MAFQNKSFAYYYFRVTPKLSGRGRSEPSPFTNGGTQLRRWQAKLQDRPAWRRCASLALQRLTTTGQYRPAQGLAPVWTHGVGASEWVMTQALRHRTCGEDISSAALRQRRLLGEAADHHSGSCPHNTFAPASPPPSPQAHLPPTL